MIREKLYVVDIILTDGRGSLTNCVVFDPEAKSVDSIQDKQVLEDIFTGRNRCCWKIGFQNRAFSGKTSMGNIQSYVIHEINGRDF